MAKHTNDAIELGCSKLPAIMGYSPWQTPNDVLGIVRSAQAGTPVENKPNGFMNFGNYCEPGIRDWIRDELGWEVAELLDAERKGPPGLAASLDGLVIAGHGITIVDTGGVAHILKGSGPLEIKTTSEENDEPMIGYQIQLQGQMLCSGTDWGVIVEVPRRRPQLRVHVIRKHWPTQQAIISAVADFWLRVKENRPYPPMNKADASALFPSARAKATIDLSKNNEIGELVDSLDAAERAIAAAEEIKEKTEARIMEILGEHEIGLLGDGRKVIWPMRSYKAQPEKITPAKPARTIRLNTIEIKDAI